jgi:alkyldihydroxyacetonephosphate synthase
MRRWNGWGETSTEYPLPASAAAYLAGLVGEGLLLEDAPLEGTLASIPPSSLHAPPSSLLVSTDPSDRLLHARGQSLPDWIALRSGRIGVFPDGVAYPASDEAVRALLDYARQTGARLIPYGGGTSVVGHINPRADGAPSVTMDMSRMNRLLDFDAASRLAAFEAGIPGPEIEKQLGARGCTLGHFPQSFEYSTLGGWIAARSSGQQSYYYGRIENLFAGGHVETPRGVLDLPPHPASAAGPDLCSMLLGSEGRLGVITRAVVRVRPLPEAESFHAFFFHDWETGAAAVRAIAQAGLKLSMLRLSNAVETATTLALSGKEKLVEWAGRGLSILRYGEGRCLLIAGFTAEKMDNAARQQFAAARDVIRTHGGLWTGAPIGRMWMKSRFLTPYLRNTLWERGYALDTLETALPWSQVQATAEETQQVIRDGLQDIGERVLVFAHISHVYKDGAGIYVTYLYRRRADPDETLRRWQILKGAASRVILAHGGTISHQHGVGVDHAPYLAAEKGPLGMEMIAALRRQFDPDRIMNPGKLIEE